MKPSIQPELWVARASAAVAFYQAAFGASVVHQVGLSTRRRERSSSGSPGGASSTRQSNSSGGTSPTRHSITMRPLKGMSTVTRLWQPG